MKGHNHLMGEIMTEFTLKIDGLILSEKEARSYFNDLNHTHEIIDYINDEEIQCCLLGIYSELGVLPLEIYLRDLLMNIKPKSRVSIAYLEDIVTHNANLQNIPQIMVLLERMESVPDSIDMVCWFLIKFNSRLRKGSLRYKPQINNPHITRTLELFSKDFSFDPPTENEFWKSVYCSLYERRQQEIDNPSIRHKLYK